MALSPANPPGAALPVPLRLEQTGLPPAFVKDLILKLVRFSSRITGAGIAEQLGLPHPLFAPLLRELRLEQAVEVVRSATPLEVGYEYVLTATGRARADEALESCGYIGPAPVTLDEYTMIARAQGATLRAALQPGAVRQALDRLVLPDDLIERLGSALNAGRSMFLYGDPGNGKTSIAEALGRLPGEVFVPHAVFVDAGSVIRVFDPSAHIQTIADRDARHDRRWVRCRLPFVAVGGEMTLAQMDLRWDAAAGSYQASLPMRAAGGFLLIDDFGRQADPPWTLLNRWIVPLEKGADYLTLRTGKKIEVPFDVYTIFSTNLGLDQLKEEAFWRRIGNKIEIGDPPVPDYVEILRRVCDQRGVIFSPDGVRHLLNRHYWDAERQRFIRPLRACHPRDLVAQLVSVARYRGLRPALTPELIDAAARAVFVNQPEGLIARTRPKPQRKLRPLLGRRAHADE